jgi:hypothetical protein
MIRRHSISFGFALAVSLAFGLACASSGSGGGAAPAEAAAQEMAIPPESPLAKVALDMNEQQVRDILGPPDDSNAYMTGKQFIPYYYGPDTSRTDWLYKGQGRVVFSRNRYTGGLKVIRVMYNPDDSL